MEDKIVYKFISKVKDKLSKNKTTYPSIDEYAFSSEELASINQKNKEKIKELKQDLFSNKKVIESEENELDDAIISPIEGKTVIASGVDEEMLENYKQGDGVEDCDIDKNDDISLKNSKDEEMEYHSFIHLSKENQDIIMSKWNEIDSNKIDEDIMSGKELFNHNYVITYADDAARFIHRIRKEYEVVLCYLIGFNNEKKGVYEKTIFSSKLDDEWKYLSNYIKVLEKIRSFKK